MRAEHINCFIGAVRNVFGTMLNTDVALGKPGVQSDGRLTNDVTGIISLSGDVIGAVALSFPLQTATNVVEAFAGIRFEPGSDEFSDAIGELANMVSGNAKKDMDGMAVSISVPTVIVGSNHRIGRNPLGPWIVMECASHLGDFTVEVCIVRVASLQPTNGGQTCES